ncbi:mevalonate kinase [Streptomyces sp. NPDC086554]|uniref:mevalonate kinase n=1 Tax=Streptomyces sp. NPDC086554 TaxID=3154864 RepID=UPI0034197C87
MASTNPSTYADHGSPEGDPDAGRGRLGVGRAHGKVILLGEHAVVYGAPALAMPVSQLTATVTVRRCSCPDGSADQLSFAVAGSGAAPVTPLATDGLRRLVAEFKEKTGAVGRVCAGVLVDCAIPQGRGLGSSAACARAAVLAFAELFDRRLDAKEVFDLVQASETLAHGRSSGIDALATGATYPILFRAGTARELPSLDGVCVIADSGVGGSTKDAVEMVRRKFERNADAQAEFVRRVSSLARGAADDLAHGRSGDFGARLTENHRLLRDLGLSTDRIDALVDAALAAGGLGAKISGGGLGGCMITLAGEPRQAQDIVRRLHEAGAAQTWVVPMGRFARHGD